MKIVITGESIKIGQLLKKIGVITSGGKSKDFLASNVVKINGDIPLGRGTQVKVGDTL